RWPGPTTAGSPWRPRARPAPRRDSFLGQRTQWPWRGCAAAGWARRGLGPGRAGGPRGGGAPRGGRGGRAGPGWATPPPAPGARAVQVAAYGNGFAVSFLDVRRRLVLEVYESADPEAPSRRLSLPVARHAEARLATAADGSVWMLFGGVPVGQKRGEYGFAHL